ncbi:MAG: hypothetical protein AAF827_04205 [Cyanobacteria bacterium P01_D01_bin.6]
MSPTEPAAIAQLKIMQLVIVSELLLKWPKLVFFFADDAAPKDEATWSPGDGFDLPH